MKKFGIAATSVAFGAIFAFSVGIPSAYAESTVDCDAVMQALNGGKKPKEVASDMNISRRSVYECWHKAKAAAKAAANAAKPSAVEGKPDATPSVEGPPSN